jgi:hypothetical protein
MERTLTLESLIHPQTVRQFFDDAWQRRFQYFEHPPGFASRFGNGFKVPDVFSHCAKKKDFVRLVKDGRELPALIDSDFGFESQAVTRFLDDGYTVVLVDPQIFSSELAALEHSLESTFRPECATSLYITPARCRGFGPHFDFHDLFVVQLEGAKRWRIYAGGVKWPMNDGRGAATRAQNIDTANFEELVLTKGDALYIPRGAPHSAVAEQLSIHLTIGVSVFTWGDVLEAAVREAVCHSHLLREWVPTKMLCSRPIEALDTDFDRVWTNAGTSATLAGALKELQKLEHPVNARHFNRLKNLG